MLGSSVSTPYDWPLLLLLVALAVVELVGAASAPAWSPAAAAVTRRAAVGLAAVAMAVVLLRTPTRDPLVGLGRLLSIWPALAAVVLLYGVWSWRAGRW
jgi:hypothetical protein